MATFRSFPKHLKPSRGQGYVQCQRSGFLRHPKDMVKDFRGGWVAKEFADFTPGFGTRHPRDVYGAEVGGDPTPTPIQTGIAPAYSRQELGITDQEVEAALREGREPRQNVPVQPTLLVDEGGNALLDDNDDLYWSEGG